MKASDVATTTKTSKSTNGGMLTSRLAEVCADIRRRFDGILGIHTHNDCELAVANALAAARAAHKT